MRIHKYYKMVKVDYSDSDLFQINNITSSIGTITVKNNDIMSGASLQYSTDGANWTTAVFTSNVCEITLPANGNCYFKGTDFRKNTQVFGNIFNCDVDHNVKGNLYSLIDPVNYASATQSYDYVFLSMFDGNTHLIDASGLMFPVGVTAIGVYAFCNAFYGCTNLTAAPYLSNITSLGKKALSSIFYGCTNLTTAPDLSGVTSIGEEGLYYVFNGCSKVETINVPNVDSWDTSKFNTWVQGAGSQATNPQMIFQTQALLDACPSGNSGFGAFTKVLA